MPNYVDVESFKSASRVNYTTRLVSQAVERSTKKPTSSMFGSLVSIANGQGNHC